MKGRDWGEKKDGSDGKRRCMHICIELEGDIFLIDIAAEGRGVTILSCALVPGMMKLLGDPRPTLSSFLLKSGRRNVFLHLSSFSLSRSDASSGYLVYSCLGRG